MKAMFTIFFIILIANTIQYSNLFFNESYNGEMDLPDIHFYCEDPFFVDKLKQKTMYHLVDFVWQRSNNQYEEDRIEPYIAQGNICIDSILVDKTTSNTYIEEGLDSLGRPIYINFWNNGIINSTLYDVPDRIVFLYGNDFIVIIQFQNFMEYNGPSLRSNATVDVVKVELIHLGEELTSCDITPYLGERWELTSDLAVISPTKVEEIPFYKFTHLTQNRNDETRKQVPVPIKKTNEDDK